VYTCSVWSLIHLPMIHSIIFHIFNLCLLFPANYRVCQNSSSDINGTLSDKTYWCDVKGRYREAEIQWYLDGQLLTNSSKTNITHTGPVGPSNGLYQFESKLITKLNGTPEPKCVVKAKGISPNISYYCKPNIGNYLFYFFFEKMGLTHFSMTIITKLKALWY